MLLIGVACDANPDEVKNDDIGKNNTADSIDNNYHPNTNEESEIDDELIELVKASRGVTGNDALDHFTPEEIDRINALSPKQYYDIAGIDDKEANGYFIDLNTKITMGNYEENKEQVDFTIGAIDWIVNNHQFDDEDKNNMAKEINELIPAYTSGSKEAVTELKEKLSDFGSSF